MGRGGGTEARFFPNSTPGAAGAELMLIASQIASTETQKTVRIKLVRHCTYRDFV